MATATALKAVMTNDCMPRTCSPLFSFPFHFPVPLYQYGNGGGEHNAQGVDVRPGQLLHPGQPPHLATPHRGVAGEMRECAGV